MKTLAWFLLAAVTEIAGCYSLWAWLRQGRSVFWLIPGCLSLIVFAVALTRVDVANAGRAYATYGGIYILVSLIWLWAAEGIKPDKWDILGVAICLVGAGIIFFAPHSPN
ncbi:MAG TPA: YnfA family protein [Abditibacteriaceae bacterium]|jgi:small multidrug resistance family-3 protein